MTTIVYSSKHGVMACDSCHANGEFIVTRQIKIKRLASGALLGSAGDCDQRAIERLLDKVRRHDQIPLARELAEFRTDLVAVFVLPPRRGSLTGRVYRIDVHKSKDEGEWKGECLEIPEGVAAAGTGGDFALIAIDCGKTPKEAVQYACRRDINSCLPVHVIPLVPKK